MSNNFANDNLINLLICLMPEYEAALGARMALGFDLHSGGLAVCFLEENPDLCIEGIKGTPDTIEFFYRDGGIDHTIKLDILHPDFVIRRVYHGAPSASKKIFHAVVGAIEINLN